MQYLILDCENSPTILANVSIKREHTNTTGLTGMISIIFGRIMIHS